MISFPINEYCTYRKDAPAPEWMTSERMNYCEQPEIGERDILDCISEFLVSLFWKMRSDNEYEAAVRMMMIRTAAFCNCFMREPETFRKYSSRE